MRNKYTEKEIGYIKENYVAMKPYEIANELNRTIKSIETKIVRLRKLDKTLVKKKRPWEKEETDYIKENYTKKSLEEMSKKLNRTSNAIVLQATKLKIVRHDHKELIGKRFGMLTVIEQVDDKISRQGKRQRQYKCLCDCGNIKICLKNSLTSGNTTSCGCKQKGERSHRFKDLTGKKFGKLLALELIGFSKNNAQYLCLCDCGEYTVVSNPSLVSGGTKSCGCLKHRKGDDHPASKNLVGQRFGKLVAIKKIIKEKYNRNVVYYLCQCDCGNFHECQSCSLVSGRTRSCGCLVHEVNSQHCGENSSNWNPNLTEEERKHREIHNYEARKWANKIKEKFNHKCYICNITEKLHAHHLEPYGLNKERRFDITNGVSLCETHHIEFHKMYGKSCTKEDFDTFCIIHGKILIAI